jgi:hypothetical protein
MQIISLCAISGIRALFFGFVLAWMTVSMPLAELYVLINSPFEHYMARDLYFGYETARTFSYLLPKLGAMNFCVGVVVGVLWRTKN